MSDNKYYNTETNFDDLDPYSRWHVEKFGVLPGTCVTDEEETSFSYPCEEEIIYSQLNPE